MQEYVALGVFTVVYALIIGRRRFGIPIWAAMLIGAAMMIGLQVIGVQAAFMSVNLDVIAFLFGTNTVLCIFLPAYTSKGVRNINDALRYTWISSAFFVLTWSCAGAATNVLPVCVTTSTAYGPAFANGTLAWYTAAKFMPAWKSLALVAPSPM